MIGVRHFLFWILPLLLWACAQPGSESPPMAAATDSAQAVSQFTPTILPTNTAVVSLVERETPSVTFTPTPSPPTATLAPLPTLTPTATPVPCLDPTITGWPTGHGQTARIFYTYNEYAAIWDEAMGTAVEIPLPQGARRATLSPDERWLAFSRQAGDELVELWVLDRENDQSQQLASLSLADYLADPPDHVVDAYLAYHWVEKSNRLAYTIVPVLGAIGHLPYEDVYLVDVDSGRQQLVVPGGRYNVLHYAPDGRQIAAVTAGELHLIDSENPADILAIPAAVDDSPFQSLAYAPDGQRLAIFEEEGVLLVDTGSGDWQTIPLPYTSIGLGHSRAMPPIHWHDSGDAFITWTTTGDENPFGQEATFIVWRVDLATATATSLGDYNGSPLSVTLAPNQRRLAFWRDNNGSVRSLYLVDLQTGEQLSYHRGPNISIDEWREDALTFSFTISEPRPETTERSFWLGHICAPPRQLPIETTSGADQLTWLDAERYFYTSGGLSLIGPRTWSGNWSLRIGHIGDGSEEIWQVRFHGDVPTIQLLPNSESR
jgi:hypothetical protein